MTPLRFSHLCLTLTLALAMNTTVALSQTAKTITLKDGSTLKGTVIEMKDGVYTVEAGALGRIQLKEEEIVSIGSTAPAQPAAASTFAANPQMQQKIQEVQSTLMSDPQLMQDIQKLMTNEDVLKALNDCFCLFVHSRPLL